jgi:hypothetical protein
MSKSAEQILQIAVKFNLIAQYCLEELRKGGTFSSHMEVFVKEFLRVQEVILSNPSKNISLNAIANWVRNIVEKDEKMPNSLIGNKLLDFCKQIETLDS